jgi:DNA polymerase-3 subunit epsilon
MINRRGSVFSRHLFKYAEISDVEAAAGELISCGHARGLRVDYFAAFLACLPKTILIQGAKAAGFSDVRPSWPKPKLIEFFLEQIDFEVALEFCDGERFIALDNTRPIELLLYLYFGKTEEDLKNFALRDLGIIRTNKQTSFSARFTDAEEARACFHSHVRRFK